jgi:hypothetical protein
MKGDCEYLVRVRTKSDLNLAVRCSLTGRGCFCDGVARELCTRRTFALDYEAKHQSVNPPILQQLGNITD